MRATCDEWGSGRENGGTKLVLYQELPDKMEIRNSGIWKENVETGQG